MSNKELKKDDEIVDDVKESNSNNSKPLRKIIIETNGNEVKVSLAEVAGNLELIAILQTIINSLLANTNKK